MHVCRTCIYFPNFGTAFWLQYYQYFNTMMPEQNGSHFADVRILCPIDYKLALTQLMARHWEGGKLLSAPMRIHFNDVYMCHYPSINWFSGSYEDRCLPNTTVFHPIKYLLTFRRKLYYNITAIQGCVYLRGQAYICQPVIVIKRHMNYTDIINSLSTYLSKERDSTISVRHVLKMHFHYLMIQE